MSQVNCQRGIGGDACRIQSREWISMLFASEISSNTEL